MTIQKLIESSMIPNKSITTIEVYDGHGNLLKTKEKVNQLASYGIVDLYNGTFRVYKPTTRVQKGHSGVISSLFIGRHCDNCNEPYFAEKNNDKSSAELSMKRRSINNANCFCSKTCATQAKDPLAVETKDWTGYEDILFIKTSINDSTEEVFIHGKSYRRDNIPLSYINHFVNKDKTKAFKRWIDKIFFETKFGEKAKILRARKEAKENEKLELQTQKIEYWNSEEGKKEKEDKKEKAKQKRRIDDMERYRSNPIKYSLKRLLLHAVASLIDGKPYKNSNSIIDYEGCLKALTINAKSLGMNIKELKKQNYHIDHILPISIYNTNSIKDLKRCFSPYNLRWLSAKENTSKNNRLRPEDIEIIKALPKEIYPEGFQLNTVY